MNKKLTLSIALLIIAGLAAYFLVHRTIPVTSLEQAIARVQKKEIRLAGYPSDNLPPKRIQSEETDDGWLLGFETRGSGLPGILGAECYLVSKTGTIRLTGMFAASGQAGPEILDLSNCTAIVGENLDGEADPSRMTLEMKKWEWVNALYNDGRTLTPKTTATSTKLFAVTFNNDGTFTATTDCNSMGGSYTAKDGKITFGEIMMTEMYCGGSQEQDFLKLLQNTAGYHFTGRGQLIFDLKFDSGTVTFR